MGCLVVVESYAGGFGVRFDGQGFRGCGLVVIVFDSGGFDVGFDGERFGRGGLVVVGLVP